MSFISIRTTAALGVAFTALALLPSIAKSAPDRTASVLEWERAACLAYQNNDAVALDSLFADGEALTESNGDITTKSDDLKDARNKTVVYTTFHNEDQKINFFDNTAIVRGKTIVQGTTKSGQNVNVRVQFTDVLVWMHGRWKLVAGHVSRLPVKV